MYTYEDKCLWKMHARAVPLKVERDSRRSKGSLSEVRVSERELNSEFGQVLNGIERVIYIRSNRVVSGVLLWFNATVAPSFCSRRVREPVTRRKYGQSVATTTSICFIRCVSRAITREINF